MLSEEVEVENVRNLLVTEWRIEIGANEVKFASLNNAVLCRSRSGSSIAAAVSAQPISNRLPNL